MAAFLDVCAQAELRLITEVAAEERPLPNPHQQLADVTLRLRNQFIDGKMTSLMQRVSQPDTDDTQRVELLREQQKLRLLKGQSLSATSSSAE